MFIQVSGRTKCADTGDTTWVKGRKWIVSPFATKTEVVRTCHKAGLAFLEHEYNEMFTYHGYRIAGPHIDVDALVGVSDKLEHR